MVAFFATFHTPFHTFCLAQHGPVCPDFIGLTCSPAMVIFGHPDDAATDSQMAQSTSAGHCLRWSPPRPQDNSGIGPFYPKAPMGT
jgi:excisionase family DNA binding protein